VLNYAGAAAANARGLLEGVGQLQDSPIVVMAPDDLNSDRKAAG
jgi:hypothetical protein